MNKWFRVLLLLLAMNWQPVRAQAPFDGQWLVALDSVGGTIGAYNLPVATKELAVANFCLYMNSIGWTDCLPQYFYQPSAVDETRWASDVVVARTGTSYASTVVVYRRSANCAYLTNTAAVMLHTSTIAGIDIYGNAIPADPVPNASCAQLPQIGPNCEIKIFGTSAQMAAGKYIGYLHPTQLRTIGAPVIAVIDIFVRHTGRSCNYPSATVQNLPLNTPVPSGYQAAAPKDTQGGFIGDVGAEIKLRQDAATAAGFAVSNTTLLTNLTGQIANVEGVMSQVRTNVAAARDLTNQAINATNSAAANSDFYATTFENRRYADNAIINTKLDAIAASSGTGGTGGTGGGFDFSGLEFTGTIPPPDISGDVATPELSIAPAEFELSAWLATVNGASSRGAGSCPLPSFTLPLLNRTYSFDIVCTLFSDHAATISALMLALWSIVSVFIVLRA